mgnify:FL=1|jgi:hypothetical protein
MKMEYERYSERYRRNETNGNVGIISEDSEVIRRRTMLQEQQREELRRKKLKKRKEELRRRRRRKQRAKELFCLCICVAMLVLIVALVRRGISSKKQDVSEVVAASESASTEQQADAAEPKVSATGEVAQVQSQALPNYYEKKYMVGSPAHYSMEEIQTRLKNLADRYPEFQTIYDHMDQYPEALLNNLCCNPNMLDFALGYQENYDTTSGTLGASELDGIPLFIQWDKRWGYDAYGNDVIGLSGCGPTCLSMIVIGLTKNQEATPDKLADYATEHGYYEQNSGTKWSFMDEVAAVYGVQGYYIYLSKDNMQEELSQGHPLVCAMRSGDFTSQGHFIVIAGMEGDKFLVHDPNSIERSQQLWDYDTLQYQISAIWAFKVAQ